MLGDQIKKYRKEKKMSQEELAIPLNVVRQTVSKWENNLSVPDAELLIRLAEVLGISVAELLGTDEQPHSESLSAETLAIELARLNERAWPNEVAGTESFFPPPRQKTES